MASSRRHPATSAAAPATGPAHDIVRDIERDDESMPDDLLRVERRRLQRSLRAGDGLAFSPVHFSGDRVLSHTVRFERGRYRMRDADGTERGAFATFAGASRAGLEASAGSQADVSADGLRDREACAASPDF